MIPENTSAKANPELERSESYYQELGTLVERPEATKVLGDMLELERLRAEREKLLKKSQTN